MTNNPVYTWPFFFLCAYNDLCHNIKNRTDKQTKRKNPPYETETWLFLLTDVSTLTHPSPLILNKHKGLSMFSHLFLYFFLLSLSWSKTIGTLVWETMKPPEILLPIVGLGLVSAGHYKMLPKMKREVMVRDVYECASFESCDPALIQYHQTRPPDNILTARSNTEPRQFWA